MTIYNYLVRDKEQIIKAWQSRVEKYLPDYDPEALFENGSRYFDILMDLEVPILNHPSLCSIEAIIDFHISQKTSIVQLLESSHIWRNCILAQMPNYTEDVDKNISLLHTRIDEMQKVFLDMYWQRNQEKIDEQRQKIDQLHNDRLNNLGKMAASMAHELKNPLFAIEGFIKLIRSELSEEELKKVGRYIEIIELEFENFHRQISSFLSFSKNKGIDEPYILASIQELIESVLFLHRPRLLDENINVRTELANCESKIIIQKLPMQQVLSNLIANSADALGSIKGTKEILIKSWEDEAYHYIGVIDNGEGIPDELKPKIFEPFATGKANGTGLGLSICKQIVGDNKGEISFSSVPGRTIFTIRLQKVLNGCLHHI